MNKTIKISYTLISLGLIAIVFQNCSQPVTAKDPFSQQEVSPEKVPSNSKLISDSAFDKFDGIETDKATK